MAAVRTIRCLRCPALIAAKPNQHVGVCPDCRVAGEKLRSKRRKRERAKDATCEPFFVRCCDCPRMFGYFGGVPNPRCPVCDTKHRAAQAAVPKRAKRRHDESGGREELLLARGGPLSAYMRGRK